MPVSDSTEDPCDCGDEPPCEECEHYATYTAYTNSGGTCGCCYVSIIVKQRNDSGGYTGNYYSALHDIIAAYSCPSANDPCQSLTAECEGSKSYYFSSGPTCSSPCCVSQICVQGPGGNYYYENYEYHRSSEEDCYSPRDSTICDADHVGHILEGNGIQTTIAEGCPSQACSSEACSWVEETPCPYGCTSSPPYPDPTPPCEGTVEVVCIGTCCDD